MGITITRHFFAFAPDRLAALALSALGGWIEALHLRLVHVLRRDHHLAGRDPPLDRLLLEVLDQRLDAQLAHLERVLNDDTFDRPAFQGIHDRLAGVETDQVHVPGRPPVAAPPGPAEFAFPPPPHPAIAAAIIAPITPNQVRPDMKKLPEKAEVDRTTRTS